jgi:hypothetical protein
LRLTRDASSSSSSLKKEIDAMVRGGPWQYKMDAFLVESMEVGADPTSVSFTHVPMWVQFRNIPFYLLTKNLTWELGQEIGMLVPR